MRVCQLINLQLAHCHRGQAPSHIWICIPQIDLNLAFFDLALTSFSLTKSAVF